MIRMLTALVATLLLLVTGSVEAQEPFPTRPITIVITVPAITTLPEVDKLFGRTSTHTRAQFAPIALINADPTIIVVNSELPSTTRTPTSSGSGGTPKPSGSPR